VKFIAILVACLVSLPVAANVIFPAFAAPYFVPAFSPLLIALVLIVETSIIWLYERPLTSKAMAALAVVTANATSWLIGVGLAFFVFPSGLSQAGPSDSQEFWSLVWLSFPVALVLSVLIEAGIYLLFARHFQFSRAWRGSVVSNLASYVCIGVIFFAFPGAF